MPARHATMPGNSNPKSAIRRMRRSSTTATRKHGLDGRALLLVLLALLFFYQSYVTQTHIHFSSSLAAADNDHATGGPTGKAGGKTNGDGGDPAHCPRCQAMFASG